MKWAPVFLSALMPLAALPVAGYGQDHASEPLYVMRPILHTQQEQAELCLEFDHDLDAAGTLNRIATALHLEVDEKNVTIARKNISIGGNQVCLSDLEHGKNYRLILDALHDNKGEKLSRAYSLSFKVPARHPALVFVSQDSRDGLNLWHDSPVLSSVNSGKVDIDLYRITDPAKLAEAWNSRLQTTLAPSESLYFASHNGEKQGHMQVEPEKIADKSVTTKLDFSAPGKPDFPPGLYLMAATTTDADSHQEHTGKDETEKTSALTPTAALWLLKSDLDVQALTDGSNLTVLTDNAKTLGVAKDVRILLLDRDQKILSETRSDANGQAVLALKPDQAAKTVVAMTQGGDVAFLDVSDNKIPNPVLAPLVANVVADQALYSPRDAINVTLSLHDLHKHPQILRDTKLELLRDDHTLYASVPVNLDGNGSGKATLTAPVSGGRWYLDWRQADGKLLAETGFRISQNPAAPVLSLTADHLAGKDDVVLTIHSRTASGAVVPFIPGSIELVWRKDEHPFASWKDFIFDDGKKIEASPKTIASFITDKNGTAQVHAMLPLPDDAPALLVAQVRLVGDAATDVLNPEPLLLPVKSSGFAIGINPDANQNAFPENSTAHFDVVALDKDGKAHDMDDLTYQVFEEGRHFDWFQTDGRWDYKPQQQRRRLGGGRLTFDGNGHAAVEWPVASGAYQLEIDSAEGAVLAHADFSAGWGFVGKNNADVKALDLTLGQKSLQAGTPNKINFTLSAPAMVTAVIADDHVRSLTHALYPAGSNAIAFTPAADWGGHVVMHIEARDAHHDVSRGEMSLASSAEPVAHPPVKSLPAVKSVTPNIAPVLLKENLRQTVPPRQSWSAVQAKPSITGRQNLAFVMPVTFQDMPVLLSTLLQLRPVTTHNIVDWLSAVRSWHDPIVAAGLMTEAEYQAVTRDALNRILARQNQDGGFSALSNREGSWLGATAAVVNLLANDDDPVVRLASDQAARWLQRRMENTWFSEQERSHRAEAYAALAHAGKLDLASLHYFSDTSADKNLSPEAAAYLAYAFATINDKDATNFWLDRAKDKSPDYDYLPPHGLPVLLANPYFDAQTGEQALAKFTTLVATHIGEGKRNVIAISQVLQAWWSALDRRGPWHLVTGRDEKTVHGVYVTPLNDKGAFRNPSSSHPLYVATAAIVKDTDTADRLRHHIYNLDGVEVSSALHRGETYVVSIEANWREDQDAVTIYDNPEPVLVPTSCTLSAPKNENFLGWLEAKSLSVVNACQKSASGMDVLLLRSDNGGDGWRLAYLAKATGGTVQELRPAALQKFFVPKPDDKGGQH